MRTSKYLQVLGDVLGDVLETQSFMFVDESDAAQHEAPAGVIGVFISFQGTDSGSLTLLTGTGLGREMAANVLGLDSDEVKDEEVAQDALKEMMNVVCGRLLTAVHGTGTVFELTIPDVERLDARDWQATAGAEGTASFLIDDTPVLLQLFLEGDDAQAETAGTKSNEQRRDSEREPLDAQIEFIGDFDLVHATGVDWSEGGICFETRDPIFFEMRIRTQEGVQETRARLAWVRSDAGEGTRWGFELAPPKGETPKEQEGKRDQGAAQDSLPTF